MSWMTDNPGPLQDDSIEYTWGNNFLEMRWPLSTNGSADIYRAMTSLFSDMAEVLWSMGASDISSDSIGDRTPDEAAYRLSWSSTGRINRGQWAAVESFHDGDVRAFVESVREESPPGGAILSGEYSRSGGSETTPETVAVDNMTPSWDEWIADTESQYGLSRLSFDSSYGVVIIRYEEDGRNSYGARHAVISRMNDARVVLAVLGVVVDGSDDPENMVQFDSGALRNGRTPVTATMYWRLGDDVSPSSSSSSSISSGGDDTAEMRAVREMDSEFGMAATVRSLEDIGAQGVSYALGPDGMSISYRTEGMSVREIAECRYVIMQHAMRAANAVVAAGGNFIGIDINDMNQLIDFDVDGRGGTHADMAWDPSDLESGMGSSGNAGSGSPESSMVVNMSPTWGTWEADIMEPYGAMDVNYSVTDDTLTISWYDEVTVPRSDSANNQRAVAFRLDAARRVLAEAGIETVNFDPNAPGEWINWTTEREGPGTLYTGSFSWIPSGQSTSSDGNYTIPSSESALRALRNITTDVRLDYDAANRTVELSWDIPDEGQRDECVTIATVYAREVIRSLPGTPAGARSPEVGSSSISRQSDGDRMTVFISWDEAAETASTVQVVGGGEYIKGDHPDGLPDPDSVLRELVESNATGIFYWWNPESRNGNMATIGWTMVPRLGTELTDVDRFNMATRYFRECAENIPDETGTEVEITTASKGRRQYSVIMTWPGDSPEQRPLDTIRQIIMDLYEEARENALDMDYIVNDNMVIISYDHEPVLDDRAAEVVHEISSIVRDAGVDDGDVSSSRTDDLGYITRRITWNTPLEVTEPLADDSSGGDELPDADDNGLSKLFHNMMDEIRAGVDKVPGADVMLAIDSAELDAQIRSSDVNNLEAAWLEMHDAIDRIWYRHSKEFHDLGVTHLSWDYIGREGNGIHERLIPVKGDQ
jgi:hypothetical protein